MKFVYAREFAYVGLGNNLPGIASAFLFALVTNRTLLLDSPNLVPSFDLGQIDFLYENQVCAQKPIRMETRDLSGCLNVIRNAIGVASPMAIHNLALWYAS